MTQEQFILLIIKCRSRNSDKFASEMLENSSNKCCRDSNTMHASDEVEGIAEWIYQINQQKLVNSITFYEWLKDQVLYFVFLCTGMQKHG